ncbi:nucleoside hydrolase [Halopiger xanaduensis]|uniref:Inosine/uridine-preferring nucleoside hydrolase n=1 Tax=Halopiger xanaduensis (strain DSM 18323 / JCM 14033 / SH-6) TaxID=797210 RepID=F8DAG7_HALXS|nr:nucleoside hydrolase [Halopiger xanaduensis]AEH38189.1 Inosine/uridine-preferring nucleoside hydrolase [Halopiger xanaduensis SH-6]
MTTRPVVIDTDPGCDDAVALLLALENPALEVVGLTTVHGNAPVADTTRNARAILESVDRTGVPIAAGADRPLNVLLETAEEIHGEGGIRGELPEPTPATQPADVHAARFIVEQARAHDGDLALAAIGPLTNVALAHALEPELPDLLDELIVMGGAAFAQGNATPLAEANFHSDPHAARRVVRDCEPTLVGLDVTTQATVPPARLESLSEDEGRDRDDALAHSIREWLTYYDAARLERYGIESAALHDALAVAGLVDGNVLETESYPLEVGTDGDLARGALVADRNGVTGDEPNGDVALEADYERFRELVAGSLDRFLTVAEAEDSR